MSNRERITILIISRWTIFYRKISRYLEINRFIKYVHAEDQFLANKNVAPEKESTLSSNLYKRELIIFSVDLEMSFGFECFSTPRFYSSLNGGLLIFTRDSRTALSIEFRSGNRDHPPLAVSLTDFVRVRTHHRITQHIGRPCIFAQTRFNPWTYVCPFETVGVCVPVRRNTSMPVHGSLFMYTRSLVHGICTRHKYLPTRVLLDSCVGTQLRKSIHVYMVLSFVLCLGTATTRQKLAVRKRQTWVGGKKEQGRKGHGEEERGSACGANQV